MLLNRKNHKNYTAVVLSFLISTIASELPAAATGDLDNEANEADTVQRAPSVVPKTDPQRSESSEDSIFMPDSRELQDGSRSQGPQPRSVAPSGSGQPTYSIRLPLGVAGSVLPKLESGRPGQPPSSSIMPRRRGADGSDFARPVAWRATAEAIRTQAAGPSMQVAIIASDFKTAYNTISREAQAAGWGLTSFSLPAGHFLLKIPRPNETDASEDAAAWLIVLLSPIDSSSTEMRVKIQSRRPAVYTAAVSNFIKQCQLKATGNELL